MSFMTGVSAVLSWRLAVLTGTALLPLSRGLDGTSSLPQPSLEQRFLAGLGELGYVRLHAGFDAALPRGDVTAEFPDAGSAGSRGCHYARPHLCHRTGC